MNRTSVLVFITLALSVLAVIIQTLPPRPLSVDVPGNEFSAERALKHIEVIAKEPHPVGSAANETVREYVLKQLKDLGLETETQRDGDLENVLGRISGISSSDAILLTAHLDSVAESFGATDDGSGIAVLLETARVLTSGTPLQNTVIFLFTDDEESGSVGTEAFIAHHPWVKDIKVVIGFDAGGLTGPGVLSTTSANNGWLIRQLAQADSDLTGSSLINTFADSGTDFGHAFKPAGFSGYAFDLYWDKRIHTANDNLENVNLSSIQHQGYHALSLARHFGNLDSLVDPKDPDAMYFGVLRLFTVNYSSSWALPIASIVAVVFWAILIVGLRKNILTWRGMGYGVFILLIGIIIAPLPAVLFGSWGTHVPIRYFGRLLDRPPQVGAIALMSFVLVVGWYSLARKHRAVSLPDITWGALLFTWVGMIVTSTFIPAVSLIFTWPLLFSLLIWVVWFRTYKQQQNSPLVIFVMLVSAAASIIVLGPTLMLGLFDQMVLTLLLLGILCGFLMPQIYLMLGYSIDE